MPSIFISTWHSRRFQETKQNFKENFVNLFVCMQNFLRLIRNYSLTLVVKLRLWPLSLIEILLAEDTSKSNVCNENSSTFSKDYNIVSRIYYLMYNLVGTCLKRSYNTIEQFFTIFIRKSVDNNTLVTISRHHLHHFVQKTELQIGHWLSLNILACIPTVSPDPAWCKCTV